MQNFDAENESAIKHADAFWNDKKTEIHELASERAMLSDAESSAVSGDVSEQETQSEDPATSRAQESPSKDEASERKPQTPTSSTALVRVPQSRPTALAARPTPQNRSAAAKRRTQQSAQGKVVRKRRKTSSATTGSAAAKRPSAGNTQVTALSLASFPVARGKHFAKLPSTQPAQPGAKKKKAKRTDTNAQPQTKFVQPTIEASAKAAVGAISSKASDLAKKLQGIPSPSVVLKSHKKRIPSEETVTGNLDTHSRLEKAKQYVISQAKSPKMAVVAAVMLIYIVCSLFWSARYLPGTKVNGLNASLASPNALAEQFEESLSGYQAIVKGQGMRLKIDGSSIDLKLDKNVWKDAAMSKLPGFSWPIAIFTNKEIDVTDGVSHNSKKLKEMVEASVDSVNEDLVRPQNASFEFDDTKDAFVAVKEKYGTAIDKKRALSAVRLGVLTLQRSIEITEDDLQQPSLTLASPEFASVLDQANRVAHLSFDLKAKGKKLATVEPKMVRSWLAVDDSNTVVADIDKVTEWTRGDFSAKVDTVDTTRTYTRTDDGKRITVTGGTYGWSVDGKKLAKLINKQITKNSSADIDVPFLSEGKVLVRGKQDWGPRYIDVDLSQQYVRMFDEDSNVVMESPCVTGNISENNDTVEGVYAIEYKESPAVLIGLDNDGDGAPDYENEVGFWMPFYGGYGLHDALWRDYFGADAFQYDGSHGCVNLPYYAAEELYSVAEQGDVVVVHW